jgi:hypothetical protein
MLGRIRDRGDWSACVLCDVCNEPIQDGNGIALWAVSGPQKATVMAVHKRCVSSEVVRYFYPRYREQPLSQYIESILEGTTV